jgi:hypothetical protein
MDQLTSLVTILVPGDGVDNRVVIADRQGFYRQSIGRPYLMHSLSKSTVNIAQDMFLWDGMKDEDVFSLFHEVCQRVAHPFLLGAVSVLKEPFVIGVLDVGLDSSFRASSHVAFAIHACHDGVVFAIPALCVIKELVEHCSVTIVPRFCGHVMVGEQIVGFILVVHLHPGSLCLHIVQVANLTSCFPSFLFSQDSLFVILVIEVGLLPHSFRVAPLVWRLVSEYRHAPEEVVCLVNLSHYCNATRL